MILFPLKDLEKAQIGFSVDSKGNILTGINYGDWKENWLTIGYDDGGDPIFIDISTKNFPVFTAMHGEGLWNPNLISTSFINFIKALEYIKNISVGRKNPVEKENNPISPNETKEILNKISKDNTGIMLEFWKGLLE